MRRWVNEWKGHWTRWKREGPGRESGSEREERGDREKDTGRARQREQQRDRRNVGYSCSVNRSWEQNPRSTAILGQ